MTIYQALAALSLLSLFGAMAWLITHARTETIYRPLAMVAFFIGFPAVWLAMSTTTGTPRPTMFYNAPDDGILLGWKPDTGKSMFVLLDLMDGQPPVYYRTAWDAKKAEQIEQMLAGGKGKVKMRFKKAKRKIALGSFDLDWPWDTPEPEVYVEPSESRMPEKDAANPTAGFDLQPGSGNDP